MGVKIVLQLTAKKNNWSLKKEKEWMWHKDEVAKSCILYQNIPFLFDARGYGEIIFIN